MNNQNYIIITPAKNEELYIKNTIEAVIAQTILPKKWIIVDDGSTDNTADIVKEYEEQFSLIKLLQIEGKKDRDFGSKVYAFNMGYEYLKDENFDYIGNLDADITFEKNYYESIMNKFENDEDLGIAGGSFFDVFDNKKVKINNSIDSVRGAVQFFSSKCFSDIDGYIPLKLGGIDSIADFKAKMCGWKVQTFRDITVLHHRRTGAQGYSVMAAGIRRGKQDYSLGYHPLFEIVRSIYRLLNKPIIVGSFSVLYGYFYSLFKKTRIPIETDLVKYIRQEQMNKLNIFSKR